MLRSHQHPEFLNLSVTSDQLKYVTPRHCGGAVGIAHAEITAGLLINVVFVGR